MDEDDDDDILTLSAAVVAAIAVKRRKRRQQRSCWVRSWFSCREELGCHETLLRDLRTNDPKAHHNFCRIGAWATRNTRSFWR